MESRRQQILREFEELHRRLDEEQQMLFSRLEEEEQDILQRLRENAAHLGDRRRDLAHLAAEVEGKCLQSGFEMLKVRQLPLRSPSDPARSSFAQPVCEPGVVAVVLSSPRLQAFLPDTPRRILAYRKSSDFFHPFPTILCPVNNYVLHLCPEGGKSFFLRLAF